jgi:hypothetical protein
MEDKMILLFKRLVILFLFGFFISHAQGFPVSFPCEKRVLPLLYDSYGIKMPLQKGWRCTYFVDEALASPNSAIRWEKEGKIIEFSERLLDDRVSSLLKKNERGEPDASIRAYIETFSRDKDVFAENDVLKEVSELYEETVNGIVWGHDGLVVIYFFDEEDGENFRNHATAFFYRKDKSKEFLSVICQGCSLQEFISDVIMPTMQKNH